MTCTPMMAVSIVSPILLTGLAADLDNNVSQAAEKGKAAKVRALLSRGGDGNARSKTDPRLLAQVGVNLVGTVTDESGAAVHMAPISD